MNLSVAVGDKLGVEIRIFSTFKEIIFSHLVAFELLESFF